MLALLRLLDSLSLVRDRSVGSELAWIALLSADDICMDRVGRMPPPFSRPCVLMTGL